MIGRLRARLSDHRRGLQDRLALLIAVAVFCSVAVTGAAAYLITLTAVNSQLDAELTQFGNITAEMLHDDIETMGGINESALQAANVNLEVLRADNRLFQLPGKPSFVTPAERAIAMTGEGSSTRTGYSKTGVPYRIVAVPLVDTKSHYQYALVLARPLGSTIAVMNSLLLSLLLVGALAIVAAAAVGYVIARASIDPLRQLGVAVAQVTATNRLVGAGGRQRRGRRPRPHLQPHAQGPGLVPRAAAPLIADAGHELRTPSPRCAPTSSCWSRTRSRACSAGREAKSCATWPPAWNSRR